MRRCLVSADWTISIPVAESSATPPRAPASLSRRASLRSHERPETAWAVPQSTAGEVTIPEMSEWSLWKVAARFRAKLKSE